MSGVSKVVRVFEMLTEEELRNITRPQWCKTRPCVDSPQLIAGETRSPALRAAGRRA